MSDFSKCLTLVVYVANMKKMVEWYCGNLGGAVKYGSDEYTALQVGNVEVGLHYYEDLAPGRPASVCPHWQVDSIDTTIDRLTAAGGELVTPVNRYGNVKIAVVADPEGNPIGLTEITAG